MTASTPATENRTNRTYLIVKGVAYAMFAAGLLYSVTHIYELFCVTLGSTILAAALVPLFIDGIQIVGRLIQGESFTAATRTRGKWLQGFGALVSLTANVVAGHRPGDKIAGAVIVIGYVGIELLAESIRPVQEDAAAIAAAAAAQLAAQKSAAAKKASATRKANAVAKAAEEAARAERRAAARKTRQTAKAVDAVFADADHRNAAAYI